MVEIINLRQARKARARAEAETKAADNRVAFGRPKRARTLAETRRALEAERHEGHRLGSSPGPDDPGT